MAASSGTYLKYAAFGGGGGGGSGGGGGLTSPLSQTGDIWGWSSTNARIPVGSSGQVLSADSAQSLGVKWITLPTSLTSPLTTKGDIWAYSSTDTRLPVGTSGFVLSADAGQTAGLKWIPLPSTAVGSGVTTVGSFSGSSQTNGASISGTTITFGPADASNPGMISTAAQTMGAGNKTFGGNILFGTDNNNTIGTAAGTGRPKEVYSAHYYSAGLDSAGNNVMYLTSSNQNSRCSCIMKSVSGIQVEFQGVENVLQVLGNLFIANNATGLQFKSGTNNKASTAFLSGGTVTVSNTSVGPNSVVYVQALDNASSGNLRITAQSSSASFTVTSTNSADSGRFAYVIYDFN